MRHCWRTGWTAPGEALRILVNEASKIERAHFLNAQPHERSSGRTDYANGFKPKTVMTRVGELTFDVCKSDSNHDPVQGFS